MHRAQAPSCMILSQICPAGGGVAVHAGSICSIWLAAGRQSLQGLHKLPWFWHLKVSLDISFILCFLSSTPSGSGNPSLADDADVLGFNVPRPPPPLPSHRSFVPRLTLRLTNEDV